MTPTRFAHRLRLAPTKPGVYVMKDHKDGILYVGNSSTIGRDFPGNSVRLMTNAVINAAPAPSA